MCDGMAGEPLPCCGGRICGSCLTNLLDHKRWDHKRSIPDVWYIFCPFCQKEMLYPARVVKQLLAENCPRHSKALGEHGDAVVHMPNAAGHYDHPDSQLLVHRVAEYDALNEGIDELLEQNWQVAECNRRVIEQTRLLNDVIGTLALPR